MEVRKSILRDVMEKNGVTVEQLCEKVYGTSDNKEGLKKINQTLNYQEVNKNLAAKLVKAAGGTDDDVTKASLVMAAVNSEKKKELDDIGARAAADAAAKAWADWDDNTMKPYVEGIYAQADILLETHKADLEKKAAKAKTQVEGETPVNTGSVADPFDN